MKRVLCPALALLMLVQFAVMSSASYVYENQGKNFTIELPDDFDEVEEMKFIGDNQSNIGVTIEEYTEDTKDFCIDTMTDEQMHERAELIEELSELAFAAVQREGNMEVISVKKIKHNNGFNVLVMTLKSTAKNLTGETVEYQKIYEFTAEDHIYRFTYTSHDGGGPDDMDEALNSIVINESERLGFASSFVRKGIPLIILAGIIVLGIVRFVRTPEKRKKGKL